jgi:hypothetical protein
LECHFIDFDNDGDLDLLFLREAENQELCEVGELWENQEGKWVFASEKAGLARFAANPIAAPRLATTTMMATLTSC